MKSHRELKFKDLQRVEIWSINRYISAWK